jgi:xylulokinase
MRLIGLDIGTCGCKAIVFNEAGASLASASREYPVDMPRPGWAEQDAEAVWDQAQAALRLAIASAGPGDRVAALGLSVQGEAVTPVDADGRALGATILGMDTRTVEQNDWLAARFGAEYLFERTGMPMHTVNTLPKLLWLKQHRPDLWQKAARFLLYEDFVAQKMTGRPVISCCLASRTQAYDLLDSRWSPHILSAIELDPTRLASVQPSGVAVGRMGSQLARELGLDEPPLVVSGGHDQACGALGAGLTRPGLAEVSTGTAEVVEVAMASPVLNETLRQGKVSCYAHVVPGLYLAMTLNQSGGLLLRWWRDTLCQPEKEEAQSQGRDAYDVIFEHAPPEPSPVMVLPHFAGSGTPWFDTASKGAILGLTFNTTKSDLAKAILEGLTFELRINLDLLKQGGVPINELRAIGGGARSELWLQLKADISGIRVVTPAVTEAMQSVLSSIAACIRPWHLSAISYNRKPLCQTRIARPRSSASRWVMRWCAWAGIIPTWWCCRRMCPSPRAPCSSRPSTPTVSSAPASRSKTRSAWRPGSRPWAGCRSWPAMPCSWPARRGNRCATASLIRAAMSRSSPPTPASTSARTV